MANETSVSTRNSSTGGLCGCCIILSEFLLDADFLYLPDINKTQLTALTSMEFGFVSVQLRWASGVFKRNGRKIYISPGESYPCVVRELLINY